MIKMCGRIIAALSIFAIFFFPSGGFALPAAAAVSASSPLPSYVYPVMAPRVSSKYGMRIHPIKRFSAKHHGVDLAAPKDSRIRAVAGGTVIFADPYGGYGNFIGIYHHSGVTSHYGHCDKLLVSPGQTVQAGEIIGTVGTTGLSTGYHLHFELRHQGVPVDPEKYLPDLASPGAG